MIEWTYGNFYFVRASKTIFLDQEKKFKMALNFQKLFQILSKNCHKRIWTLLAKQKWKMKNIGPMCKCTSCTWQETAWLLSNNNYIYVTGLMLFTPIQLFLVRQISSLIKVCQSLSCGWLDRQFFFNNRVDPKYFLDLKTNHMRPCIQYAWSIESI